VEKVSPDSTTKNAHYVPKGYLRGWADDRDLVCWRRRDGQRAHPINIRNVGAEGGIYGRGQDGQRRERLFGAVEQLWPRLRDQLEDTGIVVGDDRRDVALFAGLQIARTREHAAQAQFILSIAESIEERPITRDAVRQYLADEHLGFDPSDPESIRSGQTTTHHLLLTNLSGRNLSVHTNGNITAAIIDADTGATVGGYTGAQHASLIIFTAAPSETVRIPLLVGTASYSPELGYAVPPGSWHLTAPMDLRDGRHLVTHLLEVTISD